MNQSPSNDLAPALDLPDFRRRSHSIWKAREKAREDAEKHGIEEAEAEFTYRRNKGIRLLHHRGNEKGVTEAEILAESDVAEAKRARDIAHVLKRSAEHRIAELERNASMLRQEAAMSEDI